MTARSYQPPVPTLVVAGLSSNAGKTTAVVALTQELRRAGYQVACFKCGPDYLDPSYHARAAGQPSHNLDSWLMGRDALIASFDSQVRATGADFALVEGVMGLFDGASATSDEGSTAEIAKWLGAKVLLVVDASGMARTFAALLAALAEREPKVDFFGAIANKVGSARHLELLKDAVGTFPALAGMYIAGLPKCPDVAFPARHLGLVSARDESVTAESFAAISHIAEGWLPAADIAPKLKQHFPPPPLPSPDDSVKAPAPAGTKSKVKIAVAEDAAFHFYYPYNRQLLQQAGAEQLSFSPITDTTLPDCDALWLGGGYPELYATELSTNEAMRQAIRSAYDAKMPIWAECGGYMYLCESLITTAEESYPMVGIIPGAVRMADKLKAIGYVTATCPIDTILGPKGTAIRGHQFRYSDYEPPASGQTDTKSLSGWQVTRKRTGDTLEQGVVTSHLVASYVHVHLASHPEAAEQFVSAATAWRASR